MSLPPENLVFIFREMTVERLTESDIAKHSESGSFAEGVALQAVYPISLELNEGTFSGRFGNGTFPLVSVAQAEDRLLISSDAPGELGKLSPAEALVLTAIIRREELGVFFDSSLRREKLTKVALDYGLENESDLDRFFRLSFENNKLAITPVLPGLLPTTAEKMESIARELNTIDAPPATEDSPETPPFVVIRRHKFYKYLQIELYAGNRAKDGKLKNPLRSVSAMDRIWSAEDTDQMKFYAGIANFQQHRDGMRSEADLVALRAIVKNAPGYAAFIHDDAVAEKVSTNTLMPVTMDIIKKSISLTITPDGPFFALSGQVDLLGRSYAFDKLAVKYSYFVLLEDTLYLVDNLQTLAVLELFKGRDKLLVHASKYRTFKQKLLDKLEDSIPIVYSHIKPGRQRQLVEAGLGGEPEKLIYLSDFGSHVMIIPVVRYGEAEITVRTPKQIRGMDATGKEFSMPRDEALEKEFISLLLKQHPYLPEQLENQLYYFYLHKKHFLNESWFLAAFEVWSDSGITVLGFNELSGNKLSPHRVQVDIKVISGINWFNATHKIRFGKSKATLKQVQAALRNKSKYVKLDDGTLGILPTEWMDRFSAYFQAGEILDEETLQISKTNFETLTELYEAEQIGESVLSEIAQYRGKLANFRAIEAIPVPKTLNATLRRYQREGLNWLNFLDEFNFGGILADDMGLGKTMQIIAFILSQREKPNANTNLVVAPASLIFNWQHEVAAYAPTLNVLTLYGQDRIKSTADFGNYEIVLTSYTTLLADIGFLKGYAFNYVFLDESQHIKNSESQRYRAVRLLQSRNRIAISGTPFENNSFDLYGQFSFACPGLFGSKRYFRDVYAKPIDQFKNQKRRLELQRKIKPFVLRRTKQQVATELPEKASMVLYCEMEEAQRKIYDAYEREFRDFISALSGDELDKSSMHVLRGLLRLRQVCNSPRLLPDGMLNSGPSAKITMLTEQIIDKAPYHKLLVFSQFVSMLDLIKEELAALDIGYVSLTGSTRNREAVVQRFQQDAGVRVFLISLKAGGTGLNLTAADYVYLVDPWWNPAVENQAIDRAHRIGQDKKVVAVRLITPNTVEEKIAHLQETKSTLADRLVQADHSFFSSLSKADLMGLLQ